MLRRALIAGVMIVVMTAGAVSAAAFLEVDNLRKAVEVAGEGRRAIAIPEIDRADAGEPRTIMILGSDERYGDDELGLPPRSDTIILARLDPDKQAITLLSIPRDLKVQIPRNGGFVTDRINAAYSLGGPRLAVRTVKELFSTADEPFVINHVININFGGFRRAVDYLGCAYVDIDRRYFNDRGGPGGYATIDIEPGYQKMCGRDALDYVRYRHTDNDLVRAARQQDFLRQLKSQSGVKERLNFDRRYELAKIIGRYTDTDKTLRETGQVFSLLKLGLFIRDKPITEVHFDANELVDDGALLEAPATEIRRVARDFFAARAARTRSARAKVQTTAQERAEARKRRRRSRNAAVPGLEDARRPGEDQAVLASPKLDFPFYFPTLRTQASAFAGPEPRVYRVRDELGTLHEAYRIVVKKVGNEYYGIQGTTWKDPPILDGPHDTTERDGRRLLVYYDGRRVRLVAWKTANGVYYVQNTLLRSLSQRQMLAIAGSLRRLGSG